MVMPPWRWKENGNPWKETPWNAMTQSDHSDMKMPCWRLLSWPRKTSWAKSTKKANTMSNSTKSTKPLGTLRPLLQIHQLGQLVQVMQPQQRYQMRQLRPQDQGAHQAPQVLHHGMPIGIISQDHLVMHHGTNRNQQLPPAQHHLERPPSQRPLLLQVYQEYQVCKGRQGGEPRWRISWCLWEPVLEPFACFGLGPITKSPAAHCQCNQLEGESQQMVPVVAKPGLGWHRTTPSVVSWLSFSICFHKGLKSPKFNQDHGISLFLSGGRETTIGEALLTSTDKPFLSMGMIPMLQIGPDHESPATETARAQPKRKMLPNTQLSHQVEPCMAMQPQWHYSLNGITALHGLSCTCYSMVIHPYM